MPPEPTSYERGLAKLAEVDGQAGQQVMHFYKAAESPIACDFGVRDSQKINHPCQLAENT